MSNYNKSNLKYAIFLLIWLAGIFYTESAHSQQQKTLELTSEEHDYLKEHGKVRMCVDPDWEPFEHINENGEHEGIAADLMKLIAERAGISLELVPTKSWNETLEASKTGKCEILSFLNQSTKRDKWLLFTKPYFTDPNVFITREEHEFISNLANLSDETMVLPEETGVEEMVRRDYPNLKIIIVETEAEAISMVSDRKADMTMRSLIIAASIIKEEGLFNLRIAGQLPDYANKLSIGVVKSQPILRDILDKAVQSVTPQEVQQIVNRHISIKAETAFDYTLFIKVVLGFMFLAAIGLLWNYKLRKLNTLLAARQAELVTLSGKLKKDIENRILTEGKLLKSEAQLKESNDTKDKFFSIIAHDLKSPFNSIVGFSSLLVDQIEKKDYNGIEKYAAIIEQSSNRAMDLLMNLMEWARSQSGRMEFNPEYIEMVSLINETELFFDDIAAQKTISIVSNLSANTTVFADKPMISTVMRNLISNAIKFTHTGGRIIISVTENQNELEVSVSDNGVGIPKSSIEKLFRIDENISTTGTNKESGTGLGLILCKDFIEKHGGNIWLKSEEGKGSTIYFTLPKADVTKEKNEIENILLEEDVDNNINKEVSGLKVLIADDDETSQELISIIVKGFSKELVHAQNGMEAVDACNLNPDIELILMDMKMPEMGGLEATRQIRKFNKDVIIITQTAFGQSGDREKAIEAGCNAYILKPIKKYELLALIQKYFKKFNIKTDN